MRISDTIRSSRRVPDHLGDLANLAIECRHCCGVTFDSATFAIEAAVRGEGVVLGRTMLVAADLAGTLVRPFELALEASSKYFIVYPPRAIAQPKVKAFRDCLFAGMHPNDGPYGKTEMRPRRATSSA
ncbi:LysR substrate-binding domain-containing protein [Mesorhizobium sp. M0955]|uniref:LysR substrate-binding domain-containing protein n=1 Tax=unclassified Mesorhizobium TaxID=325217 RepID=UPI00333DFFC0